MFDVKAPPPLKYLPNPCEIALSEWMKLYFISFLPHALTRRRGFAVAFACMSARPQTLSCPHDNSSQIWGGITKYAPDMHHWIIAVENKNGCDWHWSSMTFWTFWFRILGNSACPQDKSPQIYAWIIKFAPKMHSWKVTAGIENADLWPWPSMSFWLFWLRVIGNPACPLDYSSKNWAKNLVTAVDRRQNFDCLHLRRGDVYDVISSNLTRNNWYTL